MLFYSQLHWPHSYTWKFPSGVTWRHLSGSKVATWKKKAQRYRIRTRWIFFLVWSFSKKKKKKRARHFLFLNAAFMSRTVDCWVQLKCLINVVNDYSYMPWMQHHEHQARLEVCEVISHVAVIRNENKWFWLAAKTQMSYYHSSSLFSYWSHEGTTL